MKYIFLIICILFLQSCVSQKKTFWCGDHPCANKAEQQSYFEENLIVEVKQKYITKKEEVSKVEKIVKQTTKINKKEIAKLEKLEKKRLLNEEKELIKLSKIKDKKNSKWKKNNLKVKNVEIKNTNQKNLEINEIKKNKTLNKNDTKKLKQTETNSVPAKAVNNKEFKDKTLNSDFQEIAEIIKKRNKIKSYPNINDIPSNNE